MREVVEFDHGKSFEMKLRVMGLQHGEQIGEITERQLCVESAGNVKFGGSLLHRLAGNTQTVIDVMCVGVRLPRCAVKPAEFAIGVADIGRIEVAVHAVICGLPMPSAPGAICPLY